MSFIFNNKKKFLFGGLTFVICGVIVYFISPIFFTEIKYNSPLAVSSSTLTPDSNIAQNEKPTDIVMVPISAQESDLQIPITHIETPEHVKAVYMSAWVAGSVKYRDPIIKLVDDTELNAVVIDIKDSTGRISFYIANPEIQKYGSIERRIPDIRALISELHKKNIYVIGRIASFQDPYMTKIKPEWSITRKSDGGVWKDKKGLSYLDPTNKEVDKYIVDIALGAYDSGFDEINFDYIRYPSDGDMKDINYNLAPGKTRSDNIEDFFKYLSQEVKKDKNIPISADLFGLTTEATDDMGIGQIWEKTIPYFDYICPMVYPSHYAPGKDGYKNPALYPYEIINTALISAITRTKALNQDINKIRPWLQDFNLGAIYNEGMVRAEIKAVYDNGLSSWMLWDPNNKYTPSALELETMN
ncbi:MAG TPA: putative glycoside hydrolase [Candidatus Paceibacterota bacterium]|nr:putative glycoside hydrolase [Candidatus Paceibacterota bacterium]